MRQQEYVAANKAKPSAQNKIKPEENQNSETGGRADRERKHRLIHTPGSSVIRHK